MHIYRTGFGFTFCYGNWTSVVDVMLESARPWVNMIIADVLQKIEPSLELFGNDKMILDICEGDFWDYVSWIEKKCLKIEREEFTDIKEDVDFIEMFTKLWWKKYKQRVKLSLDLPQQDLIFAKGKGIVESLFTLEEKAEIIEEITHSFIRWGEVCMPKKMAEAIFFRTLGQITMNKITTRDKFNFLTNLQREAKRIAYTHGYLLFVYPNKYKLREYRDKESGSVIK
jgi:hypothetical protein